jgi:replicative DNA helicase
LNYAVRGARLGKLYVYSAPSGAGKTRYLVGNACAISLPYIENGRIIKREHLKPILFIATEMGADEIQTLIISYISGVNEEKILLGSYSIEEERRIEVALEIVEKYGHNFVIETMPDPSMAMLRAKMAKYI